MAMLALREARSVPDGIVGPAPAEAPRAIGVPVEVVEALMGALEAKDPGIREHLRNVGKISQDIARRIGMPGEQVRGLTIGALLHDVGKVGIPDHIRHKLGRLTEEEYRVMRRHPLLGADILAPVAELALALPMVKHHHERLDGGGTRTGCAAMTYRCRPGWWPWPTPAIP
jgi:HD-GYP domain-containing protein (c-di-GMP phosphodiesterase class II)